LLYLLARSKLIVSIEEVHLCNTFITRLLGALPAGRVAPGSAYLFPHPVSLHTFFMRRSIDVLYFDERGQALKTSHGLRPFRFLTAPSQASGVVELPPGSLPQLPATQLKIRLSPELAHRSSYPALSYRDLSF